jgi:hypothetical protein
MPHWAAATDLGRAQEADENAPMLTGYSTREAAPSNLIAPGMTRPQPVRRFQRSQHSKA